MQNESTPGLWQRFVLMALLACHPSCSSEVEFAGTQGAKVEAPADNRVPVSGNALPEPSGNETPSDEAEVDDPNDPNGPSDTSGDSSESVELSLYQFDRVNWDFPCSNDGDGGAIRAGNDIDIKGHGTYFFDPFELNGAELNLSGEICPPEKIKRDIVFIIDVSGSMGTNDPIVNGSCGRMNAVEEVIKRSPADGTSAFGVITFDGIVQKKSSKFTNTQNDLLTDLSGDPSKAMSDLCLIAGGTNYKAALQEASLLLAKGRGDATKEIYFISDGAPAGGLAGLAEAELLKTEGILISYGKIKTTIVTIMLKGVDTVLESSIASKDPDGKPLHAKVEDSDVLAQTLAELFSNRVVQAQVSYRPTGSSEWNRLDLLGALTDNKFALDPIEIKGDEFVDGIDIEFSYSDHLNQRYLNQAGIKWKKKDVKACKIPVNQTCEQKCANSAGCVASCKNDLKKQCKDQFGPDTEYVIEEYVDEML